MSQKTGDQDDDIDEETEVLYMQAMEAADGGQGDDDEDQQQLGSLGRSISRSDGLEAVTTAAAAQKADVTHPPGSDFGAGSKRAGAQPLDAEKPAKAQRSNAGNAAMGKAMPAMPAMPAKIPAPVAKPAMAIATSRSAMRTAHSPTQKGAATSGSMPILGNTDGVVEKVSRETWPSCVPFVADDFMATGPNKPMAAPSTYTKDIQTAKWTAELTKIRPFVVTLERIVSTGGGKWKDAEVKNAIKAFVKINTKIDKKLDFEAAKAPPGEKPLSVRATALKESFERIRDLKELAISSGKSGSICQKSLKDHIEKVQVAVQKLIPDKSVGFPLHWVQARIWCGSVAGMMC